MDNYYLYRHIRLDKNEVFYIGIGKGYRYKRFSGRNNLWNNITSKTEWRCEIILDDLSLEEAKIKEIEFIKLYGRINLRQGTLANLTDGGDGGNNKKLSDEAKDKIRQKALGRKLSEETKKKISTSNKGIKRSTFTEEHRLKISKSKKGLIPYNKNTSKYNIIENDVLNSILNGLSEREINLKYNISKGAINRIKKKHKLINNG
jgi:hypothetical protein